MRDCLRTHNYQGYKINVYQDDNPDNPNDWGDTERCLVFEHRDFTAKVKGFDPTDIFEDGEKVKGYFVFRCYAYIHGGVVLSVASHNFPDAQWDVSFKGFWLIKRQKGTWTKEQALKTAKALCETWNQYLAGDVYGYMIEGPDGDEGGGCWGFYSDNDEESGLLEHAREDIDIKINENVEIHIQKVKQWMKSKTPLQYREPFIKRAA